MTRKDELEEITGKNGDIGAAKPIGNTLKSP